MTRKILLPILILLALSSHSSNAQVSITDWGRDKTKTEGFFNFYTDKKRDNLWLEIQHPGQEFLYVNALTNGVGSNDIGLDRNQLGQTRVVVFKREGSKIFLVQPNLRYRAITDNKREEQAVKEAFAVSILYGFPIVAEENGRVIIDLTPFLLRDAHGVIQSLANKNQGNYQLDKSRSALFLKRTKSFPKNTELEAVLTFTGQPTGEWIKSVVPSPDAVTVHQHHSFVELPDDDYRPRHFEPACGMYALSYKDYAQPIDQPLDQRFVIRHRLKKKQPKATVSEAVEPIVYYLDPGIPEPIRSALMEGASWWNQAFEAAGYKDAFQVKLLPPEADPMDVRYNVINWTHRSTRGWSYGSSVVDPRTGEIIKGHVLLGSLRVRQDFLIAQGLIDAYPDGKTPDPRMEQMALARLRQLAAHEVGHTLGMQHNFAASSNHNSSVMDYPHPYVVLTENGIDLSKAYDTGIGEWDKRTVLYGYQDYTSAEEEAKGLQQILADNIALKLRYIQDRDARPESGAHAFAHLWDNGDDPVAELNRIIELRSYALEHFSEHNIPVGAPLSTLEDVLVPVYLMHRYQVEAVSKLIGGYDYFYSKRGKEQPGIRRVPHNWQKKAIESLLQTLQPDFLMVPYNIQKLIPPTPPGYYKSREEFTGHTGLVFDPMAAAESSATHTLNLLLNPERLERYRQQNLMYSDALFDFLDDIYVQIQPTRRQKLPGKIYSAMVEKRFFNRMLELLASDRTTPAVKGSIMRFINIYYNKGVTLLNSNGSTLLPYGEQFNYFRLQFEKFRESPDSFKLDEAPPLPAGSPIGCGL